MKMQRKKELGQPFIHATTSLAIQRHNLHCLCWRCYGTTQLALGLLIPVLLAQRSHDFLVRRTCHLLLETCKVGFDECCIAGRPCLFSRRWLCLSEFTATNTTGVTSWVNALGMALELVTAHVVCACPDVLVVDVVGVLGSDFHAAMAKCFTALFAPGLELSSMGLIFDVADHEVCEMAEFVGYDVQETFFVIDDFFGEFDGRVVFLCGSECSIRVLVFGCLAFPVCSAGC